MHEAIESSGGGRRRPKEVTGRTVLVCIVAFFAVVALVNAVMIRAAVSTFGGLETESSYKAGLGFAREIAASQAQQQRRWNVTARLAPAANGETSIELSLNDASHQPLAGYQASARLSHPTDRRRDRVIELSPAGAGRFSARLAVEPGQWDLMVDIHRGAERLFRSRERIMVKP
jgi:nitrogen fixation protein FixH